MPHPASFVGERLGGRLLLRVTKSGCQEPPRRRSSLITREREKERALARLNRFSPLSGRSLENGGGAASGGENCRSGAYATILEHFCVHPREVSLARLEWCMPLEAKCISICLEGRKNWRAVLHDANAIRSYMRALPRAVARSGV